MMLISPNQSDLVGLDAPAATRSVQQTVNAHPSLTPERVAQIRERIDCGAYDMVEVADVIARRLLDSDDL